MLAVSPPNLLNPDFEIGLGNALGATSAYLGLSLVTPPAGTMVAGLPPHIDLDPANLLFFDPVAVSGSGPDAGYATYPLPIPSAPWLAGLPVFGQWAVVDAGAGGIGVAVSDGAQWTLS